MIDMIGLLKNHRKEIQNALPVIRPVQVLYYLADEIFTPLKRC